MAFFKKIKDLIDSVEEVAGEAKKIYEDNEELIQKLTGDAPPIDMSQFEQFTPPADTSQIPNHNPTQQAQNNQTTISRLPTALESNPQLELQMQQVAQEKLEEGDFPIKIVLTSRRWVEETNHIGNPINRHRMAAFISQANDGQTYQQTFIFQQNYQENSGEYGEIFINEEYPKKPVQMS